MPALQLSQLLDLPQCETIRAVASNLWPDARVVALWVGGSLASGAGDRWSDVDFRVAVRRDLGPRLAERCGFDYPAALEAITLQGWQEFLAGGGKP